MSPLSNGLKGVMPCGQARNRLACFGVIARISRLENLRGGYRHRVIAPQGSKDPKKSRAGRRLAFATAYGPTSNPPSHSDK